MPTYSLEPRGYDDISYAGRHFGSSRKRSVQNAASPSPTALDRIFSGAAFCLPHQLVGQAKRRATKIRSIAVGGGILDRFLELP